MDDAPQEAQAPPPESRVSRFLSSFGQLLATLVEMTYTRLELMFVELEEWVQGLVAVILWGLVAIFAAGATLVFGAVALIVAFWDTHRVLVALLVTGTFFLIGVGSVWVVSLRVRSQRSLFVSTLGEFAKDRELLRRQRE